MALTTVTVLRHSKAVALKQGTSHDADLGRLLSQEGLALAAERRSKLGNQHFDLVLTSPATRCAMTALILMGVEALDRLTTLDELCYDGADHPGGKPMWEIFNKLGPLATFGAYCQAAPNDMFEARGRKAWSAVLAKIDQKTDQSVLVVGHHPFINAMGYAAVGHHDHRQEMLNDHFFHETQGYTLILRDGQVIRDPKFHQN